MQAGMIIGLIFVGIIVIVIISARHQGNKIYEEISKNDRRRKKEQKEINNLLTDLERENIKKRNPRKPRSNYKF